MELTKQTDNEMVFYRKRYMGGFFCGLVLSFFPLGVLIINLPLLVSSYRTYHYNIQTTNLNCQRIAPGLVNCQRKQSNLFGLLPASVTSFARITKAEYNGTWVNLVDNEGRKNNIFSSPNNFTNEGQEKTIAIIKKINSFIKSNSPTFAITIGQDFFIIQVPEGVSDIFLFLLFLSLPGVLIMYLCLTSEAWIFDKSSSLFIKKTKLPLIPEIRSSESLTNVQELQIIQVSRILNGDEDVTNNDCYGYYKLEFLLKSNIRSNIFRYDIFGPTSLPKVEEVIKLGNFLQIPVNKIMLDQVNETEKDLN